MIAPNSPEARGLRLYKTPPWQHQVDAWEFVSKHPAALIDAGMGTGKSRVVVDTIANDPTLRKTLILCPLSVIPNWKNQFERHSPIPIDVVTLDKGTVAARVLQAQAALELGAARNRQVVLVLNYDAAWQGDMGKWLLKQLWDLVVYDEAHAMKAPASKRSLLGSKLEKRSRRRMALTGTALPHSPLDAYALYRALDKSIFGHSYASFKAQYAIQGGFNGKIVVGFRNQEDFRRRFDRIRFHTSRDVLDLPPTIHDERIVALPDSARRVYETLEREFYVWIEGGECTPANALVKLLRLQQLTSGHLPVTDEQTGAEGIKEIHSAKADALADIFDGLDVLEPIVVFCRFRRDLEAVHAVAEATKRASLELSGSRKQLEDWQRGEAPVLAVQISAGSEGIDLTRAAYCVFFSLGFSLAQFEQALARVHRPGQTRTTHYFHLIAERTIDQRVYGALSKRRDVIAEFIGVGRGAPTNEATIQEAAQ